MPRLTINILGNPPMRYGITLDDKLITLGRDADNDIVLDSVSASKYHAQLVRVTRGHELRDIGSTNGMKFNGQLMQRIRLEDGTSGTIGDVEFKFELSPTEIETLASERMSLPPLPQNVTQGSAQVSDNESQGQAAPLPWKDDNGKTGMTSAKKSNSPSSMLLFFVLAVLALFLGLTLRHHEDTGRWLFLDL